MTIFFIIKFSKYIYVIRLFKNKFMKNKWLNLILVLTNRIYNRKQLIMRQNGLAATVSIITIVFLEFFLALLSLPLYLTLKSAKVEAYFAEKGSYAKINFDYNLRRILTVAGASVVALIWALKLLLIFIFPVVYGPLQLYSVSNLKPIDISDQNLINIETGIQTAHIVNSMVKPEVAGVKKESSGDYVFFGKGQPSSVVVLMLSDIAAPVYTVEVDKSGQWQINQLQKNFKIIDGNHSITAFSYDQKLGARSESTPTQYFQTTSSLYDYLVKNIDILTNWSIAIIILFGIFLIFLTI